MLDKSRGIVVAVSGGPDSVALLDIFVGLARRPRLHVAHLNHQLRGPESDDDAEFVRLLAEKLGLSATVGAADVRAAAQLSGRGIEETAREIRYDFLLQTAREQDCDRITTGHTMTDQAETFLMRLARGSGLRGLAAMRPVSEAHFFCEEVRRGPGAGGQGPVLTEATYNQRVIEAQKTNEDSRLDLPRPPAPGPRPLLIRPLLIRPLLCLTREEVEEHCQTRGLMFRTDSTNLVPDYTRNQVRLNVLPALRAINPQAVRSIARASEIIARDQDALEILACSLLDEARVCASGECPAGQESAAYRVAALLAQPRGLRRRMIVEAINRARTRPDQPGPSDAGILSLSPPPSVRRTQIDSRHIDQAEHLLDNRMSGKRVHLPDGLEIWREFDALRFEIKSGYPDNGYAFELSVARPEIEAGGFRIMLLRGEPGHLLREKIAEVMREKNRGGRDWMIAVLDDPALPETLVVRPRGPGETAHVLGQLKIKKLKNLMIGHRIPSSRRAIWPVVATTDGRYVWSPGLPPAVEFTARDETHRLAVLRASSV